MHILIWLYEIQKKCWKSGKAITLPGCKFFQKGKIFGARNLQKGPEILHHFPTLFGLSEKLNCMILPQSGHVISQRPSLPWNSAQNVNRLGISAGQQYKNNIYDKLFIYNLDCFGWEVIYNQLSQKLTLRNQPMF